MKSSSALARDQILAAVRQARKGADSPSLPIAQTPRRAMVPNDAAGLRALFESKMLGNLAHFSYLESAAEIPGALQKIGEGHGIAPDSEVRLEPCRHWDGLDWERRLKFAYSSDLPGPKTIMGVSQAFAAIAETGSLALVSGSDSATSLNFLPNIHCVVLHSEQIVGTMEEVFARLRRTYPQYLPRTVNFISGASRTSDIEGRLLHGIHGPRHLEILWIGRHAQA